MSSMWAQRREELLSEALVGFQGRGFADVVQPNCCHPVPLEALLFQWPYIRRSVSRTMLEHKTPESNKSDIGCLLVIHGGMQEERTERLCSGQI